MKLVIGNKKKAQIFAAVFQNLNKFTVDVNIILKEEEFYTFFLKIRLAVYLPMKGEFIFLKKNTLKKLNSDSSQLGIS